MYRLSRILALGIVLALASVASASAAGNFGVGVTGAYNQWEAEAKGATANDKAGSFGLVARYTAPLGNRGAFVGLHIGVSTEAAEISGNSFLEGVVDGAQVTLAAQSAGEAKWSYDLLVRLGHTFENNLAAYIVGGLSGVRVEVRGNGSGTAGGNPISLTFNEEQTHTGWKIGAGIDFDLSDNVTTFAQVEYAKYGKENYGSFPIAPAEARLRVLTNDIEIEQRAVRLGVLYRF